MTDSHSLPDTLGDEPSLYYPGPRQCYQSSSHPKRRSSQHLQACGHREKEVLESPVKLCRAYKSGCCNITRIRYVLNYNFTFCGFEVRAAGGFCFIIYKFTDDR